jgi:3,4-dihydroxy 2-butanone 4-phosphate synthase/GTP cyclohydrolase II
VKLLLAPDARRKGHPSIDLEPERRQLADLVPAAATVAPGGADAGDGEPGRTLTCPLLNLTPGAFIVWS